MTKIYTNIINTDSNGFYIEQGKRSQKEGLALTTFKNLEIAIQNGLQYCPEKKDALRTLEDSKLRGKLFQMSHAILTGFNKKIDDLPWYKKCFCYFRIQSEKEKVNAVFKRVVNLLCPSPPLEQLLPFGLSLVTQHDPSLKSDVLELINKNTALFMQNFRREQASRLGYKGQDPLDIKKFLNNLFRGTKALLANPGLKKEDPWQNDVRAAYLHFLNLPLDMRKKVLLDDEVTINMRGDSIEQLKVIIQLFAGVDMQTEYGELLLDALVLRRNAVAILLIQAGASVNVTTFSRRTTLMLAIHSYYLRHSDPTQEIKVIEAILQKEKSLINARDVDGQTALHRAAKFGRGDIIEYLFRKGADLTAACNAGKTPFDVAKNQETRQMLLDLAAANNNL